MYEKANAEVVTGLAEGVFMSSGAEEELEANNGKCIWGHNFNPHSTPCQKCHYYGFGNMDPKDIPNELTQEQHKSSNFDCPQNVTKGKKKNK